MRTTTATSSKSTFSSFIYSWPKNNRQLCIIPTGDTHFPTSKDSFISSDMSMLSKKLFS